MGTLLELRDGVKNFCSKYDKFVSPVIKFLLALVMFGSISHLTGYNEMLSGALVIVAVSFVCAFLSEALTLAIGGIYACVQITGASTELGITFIVIFIIMYCVYIRFFPKASWLIMFMPFFYIIKFQYFMPILAGMTVGAAGMVPAAFGCIFYFFLKYTADYVDLSRVTDADKLEEGYKYIFQSLVQDKTLLLTIIVFAVVVVLTWIIYRMSFAYSWYVAIITGGLVQVVLFLVGTMSMTVDITLGGALLGCILAILAAIVVQFFKVVVDYSKVENTQFEDDEYYYYVKAVPKVMSERGKGRNAAPIRSGAVGDTRPAGSAKSAGQPRPSGQAGAGRSSGQAGAGRPAGTRPSGSARGDRPSAGAFIGEDSASGSTR